MLTSVLPISLVRRASDTFATNVVDDGSSIAAQGAAIPLGRWMALALMLLVATPAVDSAELESINVASAKHIAASPNRDDVFVLTTSDQIVQWTDTNQTVFVDNLQSDPAALTDIKFLYCRDSSVSAVGQRDGLTQLAGYRLTVQDGTETAQWQAGLSRSLDFLGEGKLVCLTVTPVNLYFVSVEQDAFILWGMKAGVATLGKPAKLYSSKEPILALAMNYQGHLLTAMREPGQGSQKVSIRFHHANTGKPLIRIPTEMDDVSSLVVGPSELLYAAGSAGGTSGLYRLDSSYKSGRQAIVARLLHRKEKVKQVTATKSSLFVLSDDEVQRMSL